MSSPDARPDLPLTYYFEAVWRKRFLVAAFMAAGLVAAVVAYLWVTPTYEATTLVLASQNDLERERDTGSAKPQVEAVNSLSKIADSEEVLRAAIERVGLYQILKRPEGAQPGMIARIRDYLFPEERQGDDPAAGQEGDIAAAVRQVSRRLRVSTEPNSEIIKLSYSDSSSVLAAAFANAVTQAFIEKQTQLRERPGAVDFFRRQKDRFEEEVARLSAELESFVKQEKTYAVEDQRALLLKRSSEATAALSTTRSNLSEKQGQREALYSQLKLLKPVTQSSFVSGLVESLGGDGRGAARPLPQAGERGMAGDPPLLMVRVYQDAMVALFKVNAEIAGVQQLAHQQQTELSTINDDLDGLAKRQIEFERRKRDLSLATYNLDLYSKRAVEQQIDAELKTASFSNLRVAQKAFVPLQPSFPKGFWFLAGGLALGFVLGSVLAIIDDLFGFSVERRMRRLGENVRFG